MKNSITTTLTLASIVLSAPLTSGQIIITSGNVPAAGTNYIRGIDELPLGIDPGTPGPGKVWNFTSLMSDESAGYNYLNPLSTPYPGYFPGANLALRSTDTAFSYLYYDTGTFEMQGVIVEFEGEEYVFDYIPDMIIMNFPFTYGGQLSQNYFFEYVYSGNGDTVRIKNQVTRNQETDAFGTVHLPGGSFEALRASVTQETKDTMWALVLGNWMLISATISSSNFYEWYTNDQNVDIMLVSFTYDEAWSVLERAEFFKESYVSIENLAGKSNIDIYPNPSSGLIFIETRGFHGDVLQIFNITGEKILEQEINSFQEKTALPGVSPGIYICRIVDENLRCIYQEKILMK